MKRKLIQYSLAVLGLNLFVIGLISFAISSSTLRNSVSETNTSIARQTIGNIDFLLQGIERETINTFAGVDFVSYLAKALDDDMNTRIVNNLEVSEMLTQFISVVNNVEAVYIVGENGVVLPDNAPAGTVIFDVEKFHGMLSHSDGRLLWTYADVKSYTINKKYVGVSKAIFDAGGHYAGFMIMLMKDSTLMNLYPNSKIKKMMLVDEHRTIISSNEKKLIGAPMFENVSEESHVSGEIAALDDGQYFIASIESNYTKWKLYVATPYTDILRVLAAEEKWRAALVLFGFSGFVFLMVVLASRLMSPLRKLSLTLDAMIGPEGEFHRLTAPPPEKRRAFAALGQFTFKTRLAFVLAISILVPVILLIWLSYNFTQQIVEKKAVEVAVLNAEQINKRVESYIASLEKTIYYFYYNENFMEVMGQYTRIHHFPDRSAAETIAETAEYAMKQKQEIFYIDVYNAGLKPLYASYPRDPKFSYPPVEYAALRSNLWLDTYKDYYNEYLFTFSKRVANFDDGSDLGYILMTSQEALLEQSYGNTEDGDNETFIINRQGVIMSGVNKNKIGQPLDPAFARLIHEGDYVDFVEGHVAGRDVLLVHSDLGGTGWRFVHIASLQYVNDSMAQILFYNLLVLLLSTVAIGLFIMRYTARISKPVDRLTWEVVNFANQLFDYEKEVVRGNELEQLRINIYKLFSKIDNLIKEVYEIGAKKNEAELRKKEAELSTLQAQINPHFLYNTLEIIRWKSIVLTGGENEVTDIVETLSDYFRLSLSKGKRMITLAEEIEHVRSYMKIMSYRYMDKADLEVSVPEAMLPFLIPKITLQPIVENALYHGIKHKEGKGIIRIGGNFGAEALELEVFDDGSGISAGQLEELRKEDAETGGYGLKNVRQRIRMLFGEPYGIEIESVYSRFTRVLIRIPYVKADGDWLRSDPETD